MDKFFNAISTVLNAVGTILTAIVIVGGALLGGVVAWFILGAMESNLWVRICGTIATGFISGFLSWVLVNIAAFINLD
ncbi:MAG: hypothetical protein AAFN91_00930 [Pseudomonadota bacterium]